MNVCGNNYTAPHQSVTSSAIITKNTQKIIQNTIIAILNLHTFRHNKMGSQYWCSHQSHVYKCNTVHLVLPCMICMTEFFTGLSMLCGPPPQVLDLKKQGPHFAVSILLFALVSGIANLIIRKQALPTSPDNRGPDNRGCTVLCYRLLLTK